VPSLAGKTYCRYPYGHHLRASSQRQGRGSGTEQPECKDVRFSDYFYLRCFDCPTMRVVRRFDLWPAKRTPAASQGPRMAPNYFDSMNRLSGELFGTRPGQPAEGGAKRGGGTPPARVARGGQALNPSRYCLSRRRAMDALRLRTGSSGYHVGMPGTVWQRGRSSRWSGKTPRVPLVGCGECLNAIATTDLRVGGADPDCVPRAMVRLASSRAVASAGRRGGMGWR